MGLCEVGAPFFPFFERVGGERGERLEVERERERERSRDQREMQRMMVLFVLVWIFKAISVNTCHKSSQNRAYSIRIKKNLYGNEHLYLL